MIQRVAELALEKLGYGVELASDGLEALEALAKRHYVAIFTDVQMPNIGGYEATAEIRRREGTRRTPLIAMSANALHVDRQEAPDAGMDDHVSKSVKIDDLRRVLERWVAET